MSGYIKPVEIRWSDLDPNFHLRHSVYYDFGAYVRMTFLDEHGLSSAFMIKHQFGPVIFREECVFKREVRMGDQISIDMQLLKTRADHSRWSIQHRIMKNGDETVAIITVEGAWIDVAQRKLTVPPDTAKHVFDKVPKAEAFIME